jgi:hypothetical protein
LREKSQGIKEGGCIPKIKKRAEEREEQTLLGNTPSGEQGGLFKKDNENC